MKKNITKIAVLAIASAFSITAYADIAIHQNVSLYGYAAGSVQYNKPHKGNSDTTMDLDAAKLGLAFNFAPVTAKVSIYTDAGADDLYILEANATYDLGNGLSLTGGRFQSWIGYEAFDIPNGNFITNGFAMAPFFGVAIPNFHEGLRADYNVDKMNFGISVVNSVYNGFDNYRGDGSLSNGYGIEGHFGYNDGPLTLGATVAYQNGRKLNENDGSSALDYLNDFFMELEGFIDGYGEFPSLPIYKFLKSDIYVGDIWAQYVINNATTVAAELFYSNTKIAKSYDFDAKSEVYYGLVMVKHQFNEKLSLAGRFSAGQEKMKLSVDGESTDVKANFWRASVQPSYAVTQNLGIGLEVNYTKYNNDARKLGKPKNNVFAGVQAVFKF